MKNIALTILFLCSLVATAQIDRSTQPEPGPAPEINIASPKTFELKNGLQVIVVENHKLPRVAYTLTIDNPPISEGDKIGASSLMASLLGKGSKNISKDDFYEEVDYIGANINFGSSSAFASGLSKYSDRILELMADAALHPNFTQEEFDAEKNILIDNLKSNEKNVSTVAGNLANVLAYGANHSKGEFETPERVEKVSLQDAKDYYNQVFVPNNAYLVIVGDVKFKDIKKSVKKNFKEWEKGTVPTNSNPVPQNVESTEIDFVNMPNAVQSEIIVLNLVDLKMKDKDYFPVLIANQILGGGGEGRLFLNLREDKGYTYGAYSSIGTDKYGPTTFRASASVRNAVTDSAVVAFMDEISNFRNQPVSQTDLANAKAKYTGQFVRSLEQPATVARFALNIETEDLSEDFYKEYLSRINAVTIEDVQRVAKKYFLADNARIIVAGKGSEVLENLEKTTFNGEVIPVNYFDREGNPIEKPSFQTPIPDGVTANTVLEQYIEAIGGKEKLENVESVSLKAEAEIQGMKLNLDLMKTNEQQMKLEVAMMGNVMSKQVVNGDKGYAENRGQRQELEGESLAKMQKEALPFPELEMLNDDSIKLERIEPVDGSDAYVLSVDEGKTFFYDVETGLKIKAEETLTQGGQSFSQTSTMSDYHEVSGIKFPFMMSQTMGPQKIDFKVTEMKVNEGVSDSDFE